MVGTFFVVSYSKPALLVWVFLFKVVIRWFSFLPFFKASVVFDNFEFSISANYNYSEDIKLFNFFEVLANTTLVHLDLFISFASEVLDLAYVLTK